MLEILSPYFLPVVGGAALYGVGHYHGKIIAAAQAVKAKVSSVETAVSTGAANAEEAAVKEAVTLLARLADKTPEQEAMARKDRLLAAIRSAIPPA